MGREAQAPATLVVAGRYPKGPDDEVLYKGQVVNIVEIVRMTIPPTTMAHVNKPRREWQLKLSTGEVVRRTDVTMSLAQRKKSLSLKQLAKKAAAGGIR